MEIKFKGADFSANAVTRLSDGVKEFLDGCYLEDGSFSSKNRYYKSTVVIPISQVMRENGIVINNMVRLSAGYPLVIFFNGTPSEGTKVSTISYDKGTKTQWKIYPTNIPSNATCFVVNFDVANNDGVVFENYFIPVVDDYGFTDGYVAADGSYVSDATYHTSKMIAVSGKYMICSSIYSTYDKYGNFKSRATLTANQLASITFDDDVVFVRLSALKTDTISIEY